MKYFKVFLKLWATFLQMKYFVEKYLNPEEIIFHTIKYIWAVKEKVVKSKGAPPPPPPPPSPSIYSRARNHFFWGAQLHLISFILVLCISSTCFSSLEGFGGATGDSMGGLGSANFEP